MSTAPTTPVVSTPAPASTGLIGKIKHFFGVVWHGVAIGVEDAVKAEKVVAADAAKAEPLLEMADSVLTLVNPTYGLIAKEVITGGFTALGAITEAFEASESTVSEIIAEAPEFTQVTVRTEALQQLLTLWQTYKADFDKIKTAFVQQAAAGAPTSAAVPAAVTK